MVCRCAVHPAGTEFQLYVGAEPLPKTRQGSYTTAPGQYTYKQSFAAPGQSGQSFTTSATGGFFIAHAVVCGNYGGGSG